MFDVSFYSSDNKSSISPYNKPPCHLVGGGGAGLMPGLSDAILLIYKRSVYKVVTAIWGSSYTILRSISYPAYRGGELLSFKGFITGSIVGQLTK